MVRRVWMWVPVGSLIGVAGMVLGVGIGCARDAGARLAGPASRPAVGSAVGSWTGIAESRKVGPYLAGAEVYVDFGGSEWPEGVAGKRVTVTGVAVERHDLPVFVPRAGEPAMQGIPVEAGTDLREASKRVVIERVRTIEVGD